MKCKRIALLLLLMSGIVGCQNQPEKFRLATTTTTYDSGLMNEIIPLFEATSGLEVEVIAVGTGEALALGEAGDVDVVLVHARPLEDEFVANGYGVNRQDVMYNDFVLLGPLDDPANIGAAEDVIAAFIRIANRGIPFVSRGDSSGTHLRELALWAEAGIEPSGDWYEAVGQGMGAALTIANEQQAYILSDRGTYLKRMDGLDLTILFEGDGRLNNPYGIIAVNPDRHPDVNAEAAQKFIEWITSPEIQSAIDAYRINGEQLFFSNAQ